MIDTEVSLPTRAGRENLYSHGCCTLMGPNNGKRKRRDGYLKHGGLLIIGFILYWIELGIWMYIFGKYALGGDGKVEGVVEWILMFPVAASDRYLSRSYGLAAYFGTFLLYTLTNYCILFFGWHLSRRFRRSTKTKQDYDDKFRPESKINTRSKPTSAD